MPEQGETWGCYRKIAALFIDRRDDGQKGLEQMAKIQELREQQQAVVAKAREALDQVTNETSEARAQELETQYDGYMAEYDTLEERIGKLQRIESAEGKLSEGDPRRPAGENREVPAGGQEKKAEYRDLFKKAIAFGISDFTAEERQLLMNHRAEITPEMRALTSTTGSSGGYTVPEEFSGEIDKQMAMWGPMWDANIVRELNTSNGRKLNWPTINDTSNTGAIKTQNSAVTDDGGVDPAFGEKELDAYIYDTEMVKIPIELLQDSAFDIETLLNELFGERLGRLANSVLTTGTGSSQPNGIVTASAAGKTATSATAITADELIDLVHSVDPAYRQSPKCRFQFNDSTLAAIRKLKDGQSNYLWQMGDVRTGEPNTLLGHPYSVNQAMADIGASAKPIIFGDHSKYIVRKVNGFTVMTLRERYAEYFQVGMVGFKRFDGELLNTAAVKHLVNAAV